MNRAVQLKEEGNRRFKVQDWDGAANFYTQAIVIDPKNPSLYTNRASAVIKLDQYDRAASDCTDCLALDPANMKAHFILSQAEAGMRNPDNALTAALKAYELCVANPAQWRSLQAITQSVLQRKKERWEARESARKREDQDLEAEVMALLGRDREEMLKDAEGDEIERRTIEEECEVKESRLRGIFERARVEGQKRRNVPEWAIDDIGFGFMVDPVVSYERSTILEHLALHGNDPVTREPLSKEDLRPNLALRQACEEFLDENGWAVDW